MANKLYCSFGQTKGLLYSSWYDAILNRDFKPPVGAGIDLTNACNLKCVWCNSESFRSGNTLPTSHVKNIIDMLSSWGVKSVCYAGGGEPSLHPDFDKILEYTWRKGLDVGVSTNGTALREKDISAIINYCRFCGVSVDAGTKKTWEAVKGSDLFPELVETCSLLAHKARNTDLDLTFKMLISPENQYEIFPAAELAKCIGFKNFFMRPVAFENIPGQEKDLSFDTAAIHEQIALCQDLESESFQVFLNFGRVTSDLHKVHRFTKCRASPLFAMFCADGYCYLCIDYRSLPAWRLCEHLEIRKFWNSPEHHRLIDSIRIGDCPRCTFGNYNEQIEHYQKDTFFKWFP